MRGGPSVRGSPARSLGGELGPGHPGGDNAVLLVSNSLNLTNCVNQGGRWQAVEQAIGDAR
jgi:hypothetical protein